MELHLASVVLLFLHGVQFVAASEVYALRVGIQLLYPIFSADQLWRFQVGEDWEEGVSFGSEYVCLWTSHENFLRKDRLGVRNGNKYCKEDERFRIEFREGNRVLIHTFHGRLLWTCEDDDLHLLRRLRWGSEFLIFLDSTRTKVVLYNLARNKFVSSRGDGGVGCDKDHILEDEMFSGWKLGMKKDWEPRDEWKHVGTFDNRFSNGAAQLSYSVTHGVQKTRTIMVHKGVSFGGFPKIGLAKFFQVEVHSQIGFDWTTAQSRTWGEATTIMATITVPPGKKVSLYQAVGYCAFFTIHANYFQAHETAPSDLTLGQDEASTYFTLPALSE